MFEMAGHLAIAEAFFQLKEYQKSIEHYVRGITILKNESYMPSSLRYSEIDLIRSRVMNNDMDIDIDSIYQIANKIKLKQAIGKASRSICEILLIIGNHIPEAENWITTAIETNKKYSLRFSLAHDYALYAKLFIRKGDQSSAKEKLKEAIKIFKECGADGWVKKYEKELAAL